MAFDFGETLSEAVSAYRDIEVAKRSQPKLVQGIQQVQTPLARNSDASIAVGVDAPAVTGGSYKTAFMVGGALLLGGLAFVALRKKR